MPTPLSRKHHPLLTAAATAVVAGAAMTGLIPIAHAQGMECKSGSSISPYRAETKAGAVNTLRVIPEVMANAQSCSICGTVESIVISRDEGTAGMPRANQILGNRAEKGKRNILLAIIGPDGETYAGRPAEKNLQPSMRYVVKVRMVDGTFRIVTQPAKPEYTVGDRVRVISGAITTT